MGVLRRAKRRAGCCARPPHPSDSEGWWGVGAGLAGPLRSGCAVGTLDASSARRCLPSSRSCKGAERTWARLSPVRASLLGPSFARPRRQPSDWRETPAGPRSLRGCVILSARSSSPHAEALLLSYASLLFAVAASTAACEGEAPFHLDLFWTDALAQPCDSASSLDEAKDLKGEPSLKAAGDVGSGGRRPLVSSGGRVSSSRTVADELALSLLALGAVLHNRGVVTPRLTLQADREAVRLFSRVRPLLPTTPKDGGTRGRDTRAVRSARALCCRRWLSSVWQRKARL